MGRLSWPRRLITPLFLLVVAIPGYAQLVPDDIAFKTAEPSPATVAPDQGEIELGANQEPAVTANETAAPVTTPDCKTNNQWQKNLVIMSMPRINPSSSNAGNLYQAETKIPQIIANELHKTLGVHSHFFPLGDRRDLNEDNRRQQMREVAAQTESQFVLSGEIVDMSMRDASTVYGPDLLQTLRNHFTDIIMMKFADNRDRHFSLRLELRDGFTGEVLINRQFQTTGIWKTSQATGFDSPQLWNSQYGRRIKKLLIKASHELADNLKCQPFMAKVESRPGQQEIILQGGANNGLKAGDQLKLYQMIVTASENRYESYQTRLVKRDLQLQLKEVYPSHSVAQLIGDDLMNGQYLAVGEE